MRVSFVALVLLFLLIPSSSSFSQASDLEKKMDEVLLGAYTPDAPGAAVIVTKDGKPIYRKAFGLANVELNVAVKPEHVFRIGSVTKQFTAVAILMLMEEGKLSLTDDITRFLPDYPTKGKRITIEHLLTHTSGIKSYTGMSEWMPLWRKDMTLTELIDLFKGQPLDFEPGTKWLYNNSGYVLLGAIIEKASGQLYADFLKTRIFDPLGMKHTMVDETERIIAGRAAGYDKTPDGYRNATYLSMTQPHAAGALVSTVDDLAKWDAALYTEKLLKQSTLLKAWTPYILTDGKSTGYGYGWMLGTYEGHRVVEHGGGIHGFTSNGIRFPDERLYVAVLTNNPPSNADNLAIRLAGIALGKPVKKPVAVPVDPSRLDDYAGVYELDDQSSRVVTREGNKLFSQRTGGSKFELLYQGGDDFFIREPATQFRFERNDGGTVTAMRRLKVPDIGPAEIGVRSDKPLPKEPEIRDTSPAILSAYAGNYELAPNFIITITVEDGKVMAQATGQQKFQIFPQSETKFFYKVVDAQIEFIKEADGAVRSLVLYQGGQRIPAKKK